MLFKKIYNLGDKLEDRVRGKLSHYPIIYAFIGGAGIITFWRGVWRCIDYVMEIVVRNSNDIIPHLYWWDGVLSIAVGTGLLLLVGLFVSSFIGNEVIISGIKGEKRMAEKNEDDIKTDIILDVEIKNELKDISKRLNQIQSVLDRKK